MEQLFLKTPNGVIPVDKKIAEKYKLKRGGRAPFSGFPIVDKNGSSEPEEEKKPVEISEQDKMNTQMFTVAESIDIAEGSDSME